MTSQDDGVTSGSYSVRQVADMLDLSPKQIRAVASDGTITPTIGARGKFLFS